MIIVASAWFVVSIPLVVDPPEEVSASAMALFSVSGLFAPAVSRAAALAGVHVLGPSISVPIQQGLRPLIVVPAAVLLLDESLGPFRVLGVAAIVAGGWILSREPAVTAAPTEVPVPEDGAPEGSARARRRPLEAPGFRRGIAFPVAAAIGYATSDLLVKVGLGDTSDPVYAAPVSIGTGLLVWAVAHLFPSVRRRFRLGAGAAWLVLSGAMMGIAILLLFHALDRGDVSLVAPVIGTQPLFVLALSWLLLRHVERRDRSTLVAALIVVAGTILVAL
jgi:drug/metabolite transporter (DMT)-like permease